RAQEARSTPSRMTSFMIAHFAELDAHNPKFTSGLPPSKQTRQELEDSRLLGATTIFGSR
ncbi:hypothetical protein, partial [Mesorhizobium sp. M0146]|uniref:hypothetical protein n=1 Tax=unclassified Mesorhizobium TaxID=325217 RepID=UPI0033365FA0